MNRLESRRQSDSRLRGRPLCILYVQVTLGPAHLARIRALNGLPNVRCIGVQLASRELSRAYRLDRADAAFCTTLVDGVYEKLSARRVLSAAWRLFGRERIDVAIYDRPADPVQYAMAWLGRRRGVLAFTRWASIETDFERSRPKEFLKGFVYRGWDGYLVTGARARAYIESFGVSPDTVSVCGNPVDASPIEAARAARTPRERDASFLYVGRFLPFKNLPGLIRSYARYRAAGGTWGLHLVGFGDDEPALVAMAAAVPGIEFRGHQQFRALIDLYLCCGCLVLPSFSEPWGLVVNEAMHAGMPVLVSDRCGCVPELVRAGENGFTFDARDATALAEAMTRIEMLGAEGRRRFGEASLRLVSRQSPEEWAMRVAEAVGAKVAR